jgi:hypothetical protein
MRQNTSNPLAQNIKFDQIAELPSKYPRELLPENL